MSETQTTSYSMTPEKAIAILRAVRQACGRKYKTFIRDAWMDGNYSRDGLKQWEGELQRIRNVFGPSWLVRARP